MKKTVIRDHSNIENVDFTRLNEIIKEKGIKQTEISRRCGYYSGYFKDHVLREKKLNWTVANMLERVYGISQEEYCYEKTATTASNDDTAETTISNNDTTETTASNDDTYKCTISCNGEFFKKLALASINKHISIEDFIFDCILKGLRDELQN